MEKLQRQRALLQEHLRWLESEIATESSSVSPAMPPESAPPLPEVPTVQDEPGPSGPAPVLAEPEADVRGIHSEVRSGCLLYFAIACVTLLAAVGFIYWRY